MMEPVDPNADLELLAALIDGRLSGAERDRAMKLLADSDEALEIFAGTVRDQRPATTVVPISTARRWRQWKVLAPAAAAAVLAIVLVPRFVGGRDNTASELATELGRDPRFASNLRDGWDQRGWAVTRGVGQTSEAGARAGGAAETRLAFQAGVRSLDLQVALQRGDTALAAHVAGDIVETLSAVSFSELVSKSYTDLKSHLSTSPLSSSVDHATRAERELGELLGASPSFAFGQWIGAADLAAKTRDSSFFVSRRGVSFIRSAMPAGSMDARDDAALRSIQERVNQRLDDRAFDTVRASLDSIIRRRGS